jgi:hypothetical protein
MAFQTSKESVELSQREETASSQQRSDLVSDDSLLETKPHEKDEPGNNDEPRHSNTITYPYPGVDGYAYDGDEGDCPIGLDTIICKKYRILDKLDEEDICTSWIARDEEYVLSPLPQKKKKKKKEKKRKEAVK